MNPAPNEGPAWAEGLPLTAGPYFLGLYQPSPETQGYWEAVTRHELVLKWCRACQCAFHPKRIVCTACGSSELVWKASTGRGKVYSFSEVHHVTDSSFLGAAPYTLGLVQLEEGVTLFARLIADPGPIAIDQPARVDFKILENGRLLPIFRIGAA